MSIQTINPNTNKTVKSFEEMTEKAVDAKVAKAQAAFTDWKQTSYQQRAELLHKVATLIRVKKSELAKTITLEMGKLIAQAEGEIDLYFNSHHLRSNTGWQNCINVYRIKKYKIYSLIQTAE